MAMQYAPKLGEIVMCDFLPAGEQLGDEMCKTRPVIIMNKDLAKRQRVVNVIPISMTPPNPILDWHVLVPKTTLPQPLWAAQGDRWAKCDMVCTVSLERLNMVQGSAKDARNRTLTFKGKVDLATLDGIRLALAKMLNITPALFQRAGVVPETIDVAAEAGVDAGPANNSQGPGAVAAGGQGGA